MLQLVDVTRRFGSVLALDAVSIEVAPGRLFGLLGPNGSGKTTAMRIVFGILAADAGQVLWQGRPVEPDDIRSFGYMPEERGLYPKMAVRDHVVYLGRLHGMSASAARRATDDLLEQLGLAPRAADRVEQLSLGNQQRVQLAAALVHRPEVLVLDEPFSGLDPVAVDSLSQVLAERAAAGTTVLFSSHQLDLVEDLCEEVAVIDHGRVVLAGEVRAIKERSGRRQLRVDVDVPGATGPDAAWAGGVPGVEVSRTDATGTTVLLDPGVDALALLDRARAAGTVQDFCLGLPSLAELFLDAVAGRGHHGPAGAPGTGPSPVASAGAPPETNS